MTTIAQNSFKSLPQIATKITVFNAQNGGNISAKTALIAGAKIAPNLVFTSISNTRKSLEAAVINYKLNSVHPDGTYARTYSTPSGKTKLLVIAFYEPNLDNPKKSYNFQSYNFSKDAKSTADFRVAFAEPDNKKNKMPMRAYLEKSNKEIELPPNSYIDFSKGISMDKALIISNVIDVNGQNIKIVRTVQKAFEDGRFALPPKASVPCTLSIRDVCVLAK